jgi:hypothetical protein
MIARTVLIAALAGCNPLFGLRDVVRTPDAADAPPPSCTNLSAQYDTFDEPAGSKPCESWGYNEQSYCSTTVANSQLIMTPEANASGVSRCGCGALSGIAFTPQAGAFVEVSAVGTGPSEYTELVANWEGSSAQSAIGYGSGMLSYHRSDATTMQTFGTVPYTASTRWWRIRPNDDGPAILGETSPDGATWTAIASDPNPPPAQVRSGFITGTFAIETSPTTATIERINVCP